MEVTEDDATLRAAYAEHVEWAKAKPDQRRTMTFEQWKAKRARVVADTAQWK